MEHSPQPSAESSLFRWIVPSSRFIIGLGLLIASIWFATLVPEDWVLALRISGILILFHFLVEGSVLFVGRLKSFSGKEDSREKFAIETEREIVNWLITGSGVIIGLLVQAKQLTSLGKASVLFLGLCIILGFVHISVLAGGVHSEEEHKLKIGAVNVFYGNVLLNALFIFFLLGIVGLSVSLM